MSQEIATFASGCFWCTEAVFRRVRGVTQVVSGYTGGTVPQPTYEQVCQGTTGHVEALQLTFNPAIITYRQLLQIFFATHDPTQVNGQGHDIGSQYHSTIFTHSPVQDADAHTMVDELTNEHVYPKPIATTIRPAGPFYPAEAYHQRYFETHPEQAYCQAVISPKLAQLRAGFGAWLSD